MSGKYAADTKVSVSKTQAEINHMMDRWGASDCVMGTQGGRGLIDFTIEKRRARIAFDLPDPQDSKFTITEAGNDRSPGAVRSAYEKETRRLWRSAALIIKAGLEAIASGIRTFEQAFFTDLVLPDGRTVEETLGVEMERIGQNGFRPNDEVLYLPGSEGGQ